MDGSTGRYTAPSTALRDPGRAKGAWVAEVVDRAAERSRSSTGGILLDGGPLDGSIHDPFDCAQGALAKAFVILDADNRVTFVSRIAMQFLEDFLGTRTVRLRSPILIAEVVDRAAERSRSSTGGILLDDGPFDYAQGAWAKAIVILDTDNRVTFATRIAGAILVGFHRDADGSTALTEPGRKRLMS